jgi:hypothetical protein
MTARSLEATFAAVIRYWNAKQLDKPMEPVSVDICFALRELGYKPHEPLRFYGFEVEVISYPFPSRYGASVNVRLRDDPTTMVEAAINPAALKLAIEQNKAAR